MSHAQEYALYEKISDGFKKLSTFAFETFMFTELPPNQPRESLVVYAGTVTVDDRGYHVCDIYYSLHPEFIISVLDEYTLYCMESVEYQNTINVFLIPENIEKVAISKFLSSLLSELRTHPNCTTLSKILKDYVETDSLNKLCKMRDKLILYDKYRGVYKNILKGLMFGE